MAFGMMTERGENAARFMAKWTEGDPQHAQVFGLVGENVDVRGRRQYSVRSLRCDQCGFLELYAV
jgi:hypothetical protein